MYDAKKSWLNPNFSNFNLDQVYSKVKHIIKNGIFFKILYFRLQKKLQYLKTHTHKYYCYHLKNTAKITLKVQEMIEIPSVFEPLQLSPLQVQT